MYDQVTLGVKCRPIYISAFKEKISQSEDVSNKQCYATSTDEYECRLDLQRRWHHLRSSGFERTFTLLDSQYNRRIFLLKDGDHVKA